jgi:threonine synthase
LPDAGAPAGADPAGLWPFCPCRRHAAQAVDEQQWLLELFHGPTLAFKDVALQLLGLLFEEFLGRPTRS